MCGIFGFILKSELSQKNIESGIQAINKLSHRGPDNIGHWYSKKDGIFLGHTRLSVLDTTNSSNQPFRRDNSVLVYNGEIYNFLSIKKMLKPTVPPFFTSGDTEVLSALITKHNVRAMDFIDGMFSFAFYKDNSLILAVDHFGEKPLYWIDTKEGFYFSSESTPLVEMLNLKVTSDNSIISEFMLFGQVVAPNTIYNCLKKCRPGELIEVCKGESPKVKKYWEIPKHKVEHGKVDNVSSNELDDISNILIDSISSRTISDVPLGLFLSSGVDSSLIASILSNELHKDDILALTVSHGSHKIHDESKMASEIAKYLGMRHIVVKDNPYENSYGIDSLSEIFGEPNTGLSALSVQQMSFLAKKYFTVALSGNGGDEIFYGYGKYQFLYKNRKILTSEIIKKIVSKFPDSIAGLSNKVSTLKSLLSVKKCDLLLALKNRPYYSDKRLYRNFKGMGGLYFDEINKDNIVIQQRNFDINVNMPGMILPSVDRSSMKASLEVRSPFLSKNLVERVAQIDYRKFVCFGQKNVLRSLLSRYLPEKYIDTKKYGFKFPVSSLIDTTLNNSSNYKVSNIVQYSLDFSKKDQQWEEFVTRLLIMDHFSIKTDDIFD